MISEDMLASLRQACALLLGPPRSVVDAGQQFGQVDITAAARGLALARPTLPAWTEVQLVGDASGTTVEVAFGVPDGSEIPLAELVAFLGEPVGEVGGFDASGRELRFAFPQNGKCEIIAQLRRRISGDWAATGLSVVRASRRAHLQS